MCLLNSNIFAQQNKYFFTDNLLYMWCVASLNVFVCFNRTRKCSIVYKPATR